MACKISGEKYAMMYGPTVGDKVRLADTNLVVEVEKDYTIYGDEVKFGGGKTIRDGMGQSVNTTSADGDLDLVITNALIIDYTGRRNTKYDYWCVNRGFGRRKPYCYSRWY